MRWLLCLFALTAGPLGCGKYDPCNEGNCGEPCRFCDPDDSDCQEPPGEKVCNRNRVCVSALPVDC